MDTDQAWDIRDVRAARAEQNLRELHLDLSALVGSGDLTDAEANEWLARKQDLWLGGDRW